MWFAGLEHLLQSMHKLHSDSLAPAEWASRSPHQRKERYDACHSTVHASELTPSVEIRQPIKINAASNSSKSLKSAWRASNCRRTREMASISLYHITRRGSVADQGSRCLVAHTCSRQGY